MLFLFFFFIFFIPLSEIFKDLNNLKNMQYLVIIIQSLINPVILPESKDFHLTNFILHVTIHVKRYIIMYPYEVEILKVLINIE